MKSNSASMSLYDGSDTGFLDSASGALLLQPLSHSAVKLYLMSLPRSLCNWGFLSHQVCGYLVWGLVGCGL